jgi:hypothetical protein
MIGAIMEETISNLFSTLLCLAPFFFVLLGGLAIFAGLAWFMNYQRRPKDEATLAAERGVAHSQLEQKVADLRPWSSAGLADLSTDWDARWTKFGAELNASGTIPSLGEPEGPGWVAFVLKVRGARQPDGQLHARTSAQAFDYRIGKEGVVVHVDDAPLGSVRPDGTLLDGEGQPVGSAVRPGGLPAMFRAGSLAKLQDGREREYPLILGERTVAHLANPPAQMINAMRLKKQQFPPAVTLADTPSEEEATWLLALAILQVAFHNLLETVWTN